MGDTGVISLQYCDNCLAGTAVIPLTILEYRSRSTGNDCVATMLLTIVDSYSNAVPLFLSQVADNAVSHKLMLAHA